MLFVIDRRRCLSKSPVLKPLSWIKTSFWEKMFCFWLSGSLSHRFLSVIYREGGRLGWMAA
jgi:hypothetical protein